VDEALRVQDEFYILATQTRADERTRVLKQGETFAVFDRYGDLPPAAASEYGLYHRGTRFLSRSELRISGQHALLLSSTIQKVSPLLTADLTTPDVPGADGTLLLPKGVLHIFRSKFLWEAACYERLQITNFSVEPLHAIVTVQFDADFADIFEVRGTSRFRRGRRLDNLLVDGVVTLAYRGLDDVVRRTCIACEPEPASIHDATLRLPVALAPGESSRYDITVTCESSAVKTSSARVPYVVALQSAGRSLERLRSQQCRIVSSNEGFNEWIARSSADITMMTTERSEGLYPYAGVPWFSTPFGRDGIITALEMLWVDPNLARGVLSYLAATQARERSEESDAQPGKILHEAREGEMPALGEVPFARYYGSVDSTPLFVMLAGEYYVRTGDLAFIETLWANIELALAWIEKYGDCDGDGLVEYAKVSSNGLVNQGWKDSSDSISHADGALASVPIALCEVQGYAYAARRAAAALAAALRQHGREATLLDQAELTRDAFERLFWMPDAGTYALALDGEKRPCRVRASNAGHALYSRIASPARAAQVISTLSDDVMYSGWGIRTLGAAEVRYNPMSYHNGSVWPHDNALIALGETRYGSKQLAVRILCDLFEAASYLELRRMPELFCGFDRRVGEGPTLYPIACLPQAWSAGAVFMLLQAALGMDIDGRESKVTFTDPILPESLTWLRIEQLRVGDATVDLLCERHPHDVGISVVQRQGNVKVVHVT
jgi:glycogen debranching enzyme